MALYRVYIEQQAMTRTQVQSGKLAYSRTVRSTSRTAALDKCLPEIAKKFIPQVDPSIKYISVYVGRKGSVQEAAFRLWPIQIVRATGKRREK